MVCESDAPGVGCHKRFVRAQPFGMRRYACDYVVVGCLPLGPGPLFQAKPHHRRSCKLVPPLDDLMLVAVG